MDLLLIRPNDQKAVYSDVISNAACEPPFWAAVIASYAMNKGIDVEIIDAEVLNQNPEETACLVGKSSSKVIGIIVTGTHLSASTQKMQGASILAKEIKKVCKAPIFMWGLHPSSLPEKTIKEESVDYVIKGEGLETISGLVECIKYKNFNQELLSSLKGLYYCIGDTVVGNSEIGLENIELMPPPAWDLLPMNLYKAHNWHRLTQSTKTLNTGYGVVATTLGCPFNCDFCAISSLFGQHAVRYKSPEKVIKEIDELVCEYGVYYI